MLTVSGWLWLVLACSGSFWLALAGRILAAPRMARDNAPVKIIAGRYQLKGFGGVLRVRLKLQAFRLALPRAPGVRIAEHCCHCEPLPLQGANHLLEIGERFGVLTCRVLQGAFDVFAATGRRAKLALLEFLSTVPSWSASVR